MLIESVAFRFQDRALMLFGMIVCFLGYFVFLPWGTDYPSVQIASNWEKNPVIPLTRKTSFFLYI